MVTMYERLVKYRTIYERNTNKTNVVQSRFIIIICTTMLLYNVDTQIY